jgi:hypothetical protein
MERVWAANWCAPAAILDVLTASLRRKLAHPVTVQRVATGGFRLAAADPLPRRAA